MIKNLWLAAVVALAGALAGCNLVQPVHNVTGAPVRANVDRVTVDQVGKAIQRAGMTLGWQMEPKSAGLIEGKLMLRTHMAKVNISYDAKSYSIQYADSQDLQYDGSNIHKNYNGWIMNLDRAIQAQLSTM